MGVWFLGKSSPDYRHQPMRWTAILQSGHGNLACDACLGGSVGDVPGHPRRPGGTWAAERDRASPQRDQSRRGVRRLPRSPDLSTAEICDAN